LLLSIITLLLLCITEDGVPTSVDFVRCDPGQMVAAYTSANTYLFDLETNKQVLTLETKQNNGKFKILKF
jgi:striatin 1/3/4